MAMDPETGLRLLGGAARRDDLLAQGVRDFALRKAVTRGEVLSPCHGTLALPGTPQGQIVAAALRGQLACVNACEYWGLKQLSRPDSLHILVPTDRHLRGERLAQWRLLGVHRADQWQTDRLIQPVDQAIDHVAWCTTPLEHLIIIDSALKSRRIDPHGGLDLTKGSERRRTWLRRLATGLSASPAETVAHALLDAAGIRTRAQAEHSAVGHTDFAMGEHHDLEVDGWEFHDDELAFEEDRRRDRELVAMGRVPVRFTAKNVMGNPREFIYEVSRILKRPIDRHFEARLRWMTTMPEGHLNRRQVSRIHY